MNDFLIFVFLLHKHTHSLTVLPQEHKDIFIYSSKKSRKIKIKPLHYEDKCV